MTTKEKLRKEFFDEHVLHGLSDWEDMFNWFYEKLDLKFPSNDDLKELQTIGKDDYPKCTAKPFEHNKSVFHLGQCQYCYRNNIL